METLEEFIARCRGMSDGERIRAYQERILERLKAIDPRQIRTEPPEMRDELIALHDQTVANVLSWKGPWP